MHQHHIEHPYNRVDAEEKAIPITDQWRFLAKAFSLAVNEKITIYDALFIVAAKEMGTELVTSDRKQVDIAIVCATILIEYVEFFCYSSNILLKFWVIILSSQLRASPLSGNTPFYYGITQSSLTSL
ncbi:MAG: type II toxin-antitoxin system VapC family toxin [Ignisphaera sp.]